MFKSYSDLFTNKIKLPKNTLQREGQKGYQREGQKWYILLKEIYLM